MVAPELTGSVWSWRQTQMNNDEQFVPARTGDYTLRLEADGMVVVRADCNQSRGTYTLSDNRIAIELGPTTLAACPEESLGDRFIRDLGEANGYFFDGEDLLIGLKFDSGTMRFDSQTTGVANTEWTVTGYNNGREAVVSVISGTELTAAFGADGAVTGSAGCNTYRAGYREEGDGLSIGLAVSTRMSCAEPEGVMEQENGYLAALETTATYQINGDRMEMRTAGGSIAVTLEAVKSE